MIATPSISSSDQISRSVVSDSLRPHESQHAMPPCPSPTPEFAQTHDHRVSDAIQPSHPVLFPSPPAPNSSQHQCRVHGILQARILVWAAFPFSRDLPNPGIKPRSPTLQVDSLPAEPQGKPKNTRVGSLSLLKQIFPTQESNRGLLHCRQILYQLSYEGSPWRKTYHC